MNERVGWTLAGAFAAFWCAAISAHAAGTFVEVSQPIRDSASNVVICNMTYWVLEDRESHPELEVRLTVAQSAASAAIPSRYQRAPIVRITRRYDVNAGVPLSVTARITCATPGVFGVTVATAVLPLATLTRGVGPGRAPGGADGIPVARPVLG